jgi:hypothetical protein
MRLSFLGRIERGKWRKFPPAVLHALRKTGVEGFRRFRCRTATYNAAPELPPATRPQGLFIGRQTCGSR